MPPARLALPLVLIATALAGAAARGDVGGILSVQTDARDRGLSYSDGRPSAQLGLAWDGPAGWYAGGQLAHVRFMPGEGLHVQAYGGRVVQLAAGLDAEAGVIAHAFENLSRYDYREAYAGLLGERWSLRLYASPDYYGVGQRSLYGELKLRQPLAAALALTAHVGVLHGRGAPAAALVYGTRAESTRVDLRVGASWQLAPAGQLGPGCELQLAWVSASRGGPYTWVGPQRRSGLILGLATAF